MCPFSPLRNNLPNKVPELLLSFLGVRLKGGGGDEGKFSFAIQMLSKLGFKQNGLKWRILFLIWRKVKSSQSLFCQCLCLNNEWLDIIRSWENKREEHSKRETKEELRREMFKQSLSFSKLWFWIYKPLTTNGVHCVLMLTAFQDVLLDSFGGESAHSFYHRVKMSFQILK